MRRFALALVLLAPQDDAKLREALDNLNSSGIETRDAAATFLLEAAMARPRTVLPFLHAASQAKDLEVAARVKTVIDRVPLTVVAGDCYVTVTVTADGKPVEGAIVFLESKDEANVRPVPKAPVIVTWKDGKLSPAIVITAPGAAVRFTNNDEEAHAARDVTNNVKLSVMPGKSEDVVLKAGWYEVRCSIHDESSWIIVTPCGAVAATGSHGVVVMKVPVATYTVRAWKPGVGWEVAPHAANADGALKVDLKQR